MIDDKYLKHIANFFRIACHNFRYICTIFATLFYC